MFDALGDRLHDVFRRLRGEAKLSESNISDALKDIRLALLEADVNIEVANEFIGQVKAGCLGTEVLKSITPGQQLVKVVHDEVVKLLGSDTADLELKNSPSVIMMVGLHGSGKTTTSGKLALKLKKSGRKVLLVAGDVYRPAAIDQLEFIGREIGVQVHSERTSVNVAAIAMNAVQNASREGFDTVIIDTAGRLQIDDLMVQELVRISSVVHPDEILLVADAALGQEAVSVASHFHDALGLTGLVLTKLDGDARGGAALSIRKVTGVPVKFVGMGEKLDQLETFHPDRMANRILGMGDIVSLVEKAAADIDEEEARKLHDKLRKNQFDYNDFLTQLRQLGKLGGMENILRFLPGGKQLAGALSSVDHSQFSKMEAIILSMTPKERSNPDLVDFSRRKRIARGAGVPLEIVGNLVRQFESVRKMMKQNGLFGRMMSNPSAMDSMSGSLGFRNMMNTPGAISRKEQERKKKLAKLAKKERQKQRRRKK